MAMAMLDEWDEAEGPGPWEDLYAPRRSGTDGYPDGNEPAPQASPPAPVDFLRLMHRMYPLRMRRIDRDRRWLRKRAAKHGIDPDSVP